MNFSQADLSAFQAESDRIYEKLLSSKGDPVVNEVTTGFMKRLSIIFDGLQQQHSIEISCRSGCDYCCRYNRVEVFIIEAFVIAEFIKHTFDAPQIDDLKWALANPIQPERDFGRDRMLGASYYRQCAFLTDGRCRIYEVRPFNCRQFHSVDVRLCEQKFLDPSRQVDDPADMKLKRRMHATVAAFENAFLRSGYKMVRNELNQAVGAILDDPVIIEGWMKANGSS